MNSRLYSVLFAVAFLGFAAAQMDVPRATANMSSNSDQVGQGESFVASCDYTVHKPQRDGENSDDDWELTVAFHKEIMAMMNQERFPVVAEFRQNGTNMVFHTGRLVAGMNVWPADGATTTDMQSPKRVEIIPPSNDSGMFLQGTWKCSVTMKLKGTEAKVRFMSESHMATSRPSDM
ncbi:hypothetical protein TYRP_010012 [Tyrophagus putrescentiae]|nr:hypothetical protein TYRP_010012 [Tyrophagus putrescentiae]